MRDLFIHCKRLFVLVLFLAGLSSAADRTLMWLTDWYGGNLDSVSITSVYVPHYGTDAASQNGYFYGTKDLQLTRSSAYALPIQVNRKSTNPLMPKELGRWWYAQPNYAPGNFREGRFEVDVKFDSWNHTSYNPPKVDVSKSSSTGNTGGEFNRDQDPKLGLINQCESDYPNDTLWVYNPTSTSLFNPLYNKSADTLINQGYVGNNTLTCTDHNPFFVKVGTVHVYNPWPGNSLWVQQGGAWRPLFPEKGRLGWQVATIWADPRGDTAFKVRIASMKPAAVAPGIQYLDASGFAKNATGPAFDFSADPGSEQWIMPPVAAGNASKTATAAPAVKTVLMIQRPDWGASAMRVLWKGFDARFIAGSSTYCDWFTMPLYEGIVPEEITLQHPREDSLFGSNGKQASPADLSTYTGWVVLKDKVTQDTTWITTQPLVAQLAASKPATISTCDTKILAFSAYDYAEDTYNVPTSKYFYAPFAETNSGVNKPGTTTTTDNCGPTKGLVKNVLNADGLPEWTGTVACDIGTEEHGPQHWFDTLWRDATNATSNTWSTGATQVNAFKCVPVSLKLDPDDGYYKFSNGNYFPLNQQTSVPYGPTTGNNFHFSMHAKATFEYVRGLEFKFTGDDDVWIFIDKKLALDIGGQHSPVSRDLNLDKLGLKEGKSYQFDMFYSERHTTGSSMAIQTTMNLVPTLNVEFDSSSSSGSTKNVTVKLIETASTDPSVCPEENPTPPSPKITLVKASIFITAPDGSSEEITDPAKYAANGLTISDDFSTAAIDTAKLQASGLFTQRGTYNVVLAYGSETWSTPFSIVTKNIDAYAILHDRDRDGRADSVSFHGDGATGAFKGGFEAVVTWADSTGKADSVQIPAADLVVAAGDTAASAVFAPLPLGTACPTDGCTGIMGRLWGIDDGDTVKNRIVEIRDAIPPVSDSAWLVYDTLGTGADTLYVRASEAVVGNATSTDAATAAWVLLGSSGSPRLLADIPVRRGNVLVFALAPATDPVIQGDSVRLGSLVVDGSGNIPGTVSHWVPIAANPRVKGWMLDVNGDGLPDSLGVGGRNDLDRVRSLSLKWQTADGVDTLLSIVTPTGLKTGVRLPASTLKDATSCRGCNVTFTLDDGSTTVGPILDSIAAVAVKAVLITAGEGEPDTLEVRLSEGIRTGYADYVRLSTDSAGTASGLTAASVTAFALEGRVLRLILQNGSVGASLDWLRLAAGVQDSVGAAVGTSSKWVPLKVRPSGSANLYDTDGDGRADSIQFTVRGSIAAVLASSSTPVTDATLSWKDVDGRTVTRTWSLEGNTGASFGLHPADETLWFPFGATSCPGSNCTIALGEFEWPLLDQVAPIALSGSYRFGKSGAADTLRVRLSEPLSVVSASPVWFEFGTEAGLYGPVSHATATLSFKGDSAFVLVPSAVGPSTEVTSIRMASGSEAGKLVDRATKTKVGATSPWAPLSFGLRPLKLTVGTQPSLRSNGGENTWPVPTAGTPQLEILVRQAGSSAAWQSVTGGRFGNAVVNDTAHLVGLLLTVNRPLTGALYIYDHLGVSVGRISLENLAKAWKADAAAQDKVREVWIGWNGTGTGNQFVGSGVYLMRLVGVFQNEDGSTEVRNLVQKVGWQKK